MKVYFEREDDLQVNLARLFKIGFGEINLIVDNVNNTLPKQDEKPTILFSLRDSEEFNGNAHYNKFPEIMIENKGGNNLFSRGNSIAIKFPVEINEAFMSSTSSKIVKVKRDQSTTLPDSILIGYSFSD